MKNNEQGLCEAIKKYLTFLSLEEAWNYRIKKAGQKKVFKEIMAENFPNLAKDINLQIQEAKSICRGNILQEHRGNQEI